MRSDAKPGLRLRRLHCGELLQFEILTSNGQSTFTDEGVETSPDLWLYRINSPLAMSTTALLLNHWPLSEVSIAEI